MEGFRDQDRIRMLVAGLPPEEKEVLRAIVGAAGPVSYDEHLKSFSRPLTEKQPMSWTPPIDRLASLGLAAIGFIGHEVAIVIPAGLRPAIQLGLKSLIC